MKKDQSSAPWRRGVEPRWAGDSKLAIGTAYYGPYWGGIQLDKAVFPVLFAWRLWRHEALGDLHPYEMIRPACGVPDPGGSGRSGRSSRCRAQLRALPPFAN